MADELLHIFDKGTCLTQQQMLDYLDGKLSAEESRVVEEHVSGCELCSDALEGLANLKHKEQLPVIVQQIQHQLRKELKSHQAKNKKMKYYTWLSAVVIIILIILLVAFFSIHYSLQKQQKHHHQKDSTEKTIDN